MPAHPAPATPPHPARVGRYQILLPIASGGMATVFLARARGAGGFERDVALKLTHAHLRDASDFTDTLLDEAKLAAGIRHPNVVSVLDVGDDAAGVFLVMDYIEGDTLSALLRRVDDGAPLPQRVGVKILLDSLAGLHAAHELTDAAGVPLGLVHRDFTPQNLLVGLDGITRLVDFGVAKAAGRLASTRSGMIKGKIGYLSPEQARGLALDRRCDVWAAGVLTWELFAGRRLFRADNEVTLLLQIVEGTPPRLSSVVEVPPAIDDVVARALQPRASDRWPTAKDFRAALAEACRDAPGVADIEEVSTFVSARLAAKIAQRRARVVAAAADRGADDAVLDAASSLVTPSASTGLEPVGTSEVPTRVDAAPAELHPETPPSSARERDLPGASPGAESTEATLDVARALRPRRRVLWAVAASVMLVGAVAAAGFSGDGRAGSTSIASGAPSEAPAGGRGALAPSPSPSPSVAWEPPPVTVPSTAASAPASAAASVPAPPSASHPKPIARPVAPRPLPSGPPPLAPSPYGR